VLFIITRLDLGGAQKHVFDLASGLANKYTCFVENLPREHCFPLSFHETIFAIIQMMCV
jgi:hypothetical protein